MAHHWSDHDIEATAERFKAVAHPLRLSIVCLLAQGERTVGEICEAVGTSQPNVTQHLGILRDKALLASRKDANRVYYRIADHRLESIIGILANIYCH